MKVFACVLIASALVTARPMSADEPPPPEIFVNLFPARGYVPAGSERRVYTFQVWAIDPAEPHESKGLTETLLEPGQTREVSVGHGKAWEIKGTVTLKEDAHVMYRVVLLRNGGQVSWSLAGIQLTSDKENE